jgi:hypothetical protein
LVHDTGLELHGKVIRAGVQQSEVHFDDGQTRIVPNQYLIAGNQIAGSTSDRQTTGEMPAARPAVRPEPRAFSAASRQRPARRIGVYVLATRTKAL